MKIAAVTGGNKGIGLAIVKGIAKRFEGSVYLTGR
jgi:carbonyl reductase 1